MFGYQKDDRVIVTDVKGYPEGKNVVRLGDVGRVRGFRDRTVRVYIERLDTTRNFLPHRISKRRLAARDHSFVYGSGR